MRPLACSMTASALLLLAAPALAQTPCVYQGVLRVSDVPVNGSADFQLRVFSSPTGAGQVAPTLDLNAVPVVDGRFTLPLDFAAGVLGDGERYLELAVRAPAGTGNFIILTPRQHLAAVPYAQKVPGLDAHSLDASDGFPADALFMSDEGYVGIGTSAPQGPLDVRVGSAYVRIDAVHGDLHMNGGPDAVAGLVNDSTGPSARTEIIVNNWPQLVINGGGGVGIGTVNPLRRFTVVDGGIFTARFESVGALYAGVEFGSVSSNTTWSLLSGPTGMLQFVKHVGQGLTPVVIAANDWVGLSKPVPEFRLDLVNFGAPEGRGRANQWVTYSSARWKENVRTLDGALDRLMRLRAVSFEWTPEHGGARDLGFVAEEVGQVLPEVVTWEPGGIWARGMAYDRVSALAVEAIKEQQGSLKELGRSEAGMSERLERLRFRLEALEALAR